MDSLPTSGRFESPELERLFIDQFRQKYWLQNTVAAVAGLFLFALFGVVDRLVMPDGWEVLWRIRFGVTFPLLMVIFALQFLPRFGRRYSGPIIFTAMMVAGPAITVMNLHMPPGAENLYFYGLLVVIIFGHVFWRTHYAWPTAASILIFACYLFITLRLGHVSLAQLVAAGFYYFTALVIFIYAGWFFERQERGSFLLQRELQMAATTDSLTGIANRRAFFERLAEEWRRARREGEPLALLAVDLDNMKAINDSGGHASGDRALQKVARVLAAHARRPGDQAARLGGDEFMLLLAGSDGRAACRLASEVVREVASGDEEPAVSVSIGVAAVVPEGGQEHEWLLRQADLALYEAKREGRCRAVCRLADGTLRPADQISA